MKQKYLLLYLLCMFTAMPFGAKAQRTLEYSLSFANSDFQMQQVHNYDTTATTYVIKSSKYQLYSQNDPTQPELPIIYVTLLLPCDASYAGFSYTKSNKLFRNYLLTVGREPQVISSRNNSSSTSCWYPYGTYDSSIEFAGTTTESGYRMVTFIVRPIRYIYTRSGKISYVSSFKLTINLNDAEVLPLRTSKQGARERDIIEERIWNKERMNDYYVGTNSSEPLPSPGIIDPFYRDRYIIITNNELKTAFQPLLRWKELKGLDANIITVEEIDTMASLSIDTGIQKIKHYLKQEFENNPVADSIDFYVLLGGDANIVPTAYCAPSSSNSYIELPSDMYYACVSDSNWTWIGEGHYLLPSLMPFKKKNDLFVSRASVRTSEQVAVFTNKVIAYETNPPINGIWGNKMLFLGENIKIAAQDENVLPHDDEVIGRAIIEDAIDIDRQTDADYIFSSASNLYSDTLYMSDYNNRKTFVDNERVVEKLQGYYSVVNELSHGEHDGWQYYKLNGENYPYFFNSQNALSINSAYPKIIVSSACYTNEFDTDTVDIYHFADCEHPSLSEVLMRNPTSGVIGYIGNSRESPINRYRYELGDYFHMSININYRIMKSLYSSETNNRFTKKNLGQIVAYAKSNLVMEQPEDRRVILATNTLGDPEMPLYTETPKTFDNINSVFNGDTLFVISNDSSTYEVLLHLYYGTNDEEWYKSATPLIVDIAGIDSFDVVLLRQNYIPQITRYYSSKFIQNKTLTETDNIDGEYQYIYVGRNVTDKKPTGNVVVSQGKTVTLKAQKGVYIKNGFTNPLGSTFEIDIVQPNETNNNP